MEPKRVEEKFSGINNPFLAVLCAAAEMRGIPRYDFLNGHSEKEIMEEGKPVYMGEK